MIFLPAIRRFVRSPKVILGELAGLAFLGALGAVKEDWHVFSSAWFLAATALTTASLTIVLLEQFRRLRAGWTVQLTEAHFSSAPFRAEFERPATARQPQVKIWSERRIGLAGSFVFHCGLLLIIVAGMLRALFATDAATDVLEGETLAPQASAWAGQFPGVLAKPFALDREITLREVKATRYADGDLRSLSVRLAVEGAEREVQINQEARVNGRRIYVGHEFGPAALLEWQPSAATPPAKQGLLLAEANGGNFEGKLAINANRRVYFRSHIDDAGNRSGILEARVMHGDALVSATELPVGGTLALPDGGRITLHGLPTWARLHGSRDSALPLAFAGMLLAMLGATMIFTLIKRDCCVVITPLGERERVFVALKPQRFAPLFQERFEQLVNEQRSRNGASAERRHSMKPQTAALCRGAATLLIITGGFALTSGCGRVSPSEAKKLVERYNRVVSEAYRRGDVRLVDPVVGPNEGRKLTGLIGVRLDMGITLDSKLLSLEITGIEKSRAELRVRTKERWSYRDLKIGSGEQLGEASVDSYEMLYLFKLKDRAWLVDEIQFAAPPQVGRKTTPWAADHRALHGLPLPAVKKEAQPQ
jgi:hypothetical protein